MSDVCSEQRNQPSIIEPWTAERVLAAAASIGPFEQQQVLDAFGCDTFALVVALRDGLPKLEGLARLNVAALLLRLQHDKVPY